MIVFKVKLPDGEVQPVCVFDHTSEGALGDYVVIAAAIDRIDAIDLVAALQAVAGGFGGLGSDEETLSVCHTVLLQNLDSNEFFVPAMAVVATASYIRKNLRAVTRS